MQLQEQEDHDYTRTRVPENKTVNGFKIATVLASISLTLPVFYLGSQVSLSLGLAKASYVFMGVSFVLSLLCIVTGIIGNRARLSAYMLLHYSFGKKGVMVINALIAVSLLGWYAVTLEVFGIAITDSLQSIFNVHFPTWAAIIIGSILMTSTAVFGFKSVERFSIIVIPIKLIFVFFVLYVTTQQSSLTTILSIPGNGSMSMRECISAIMGTSILAPILMPDCTRFARKDKDSIIAVLGIIIGFPLVLFAGGIPSLVTGEVDIMKIMTGIGLTIPALIIIIFLGAWTTNSVNLYDTQLTISTLFTKTKAIKLGIIASATGTVLALLGVTTYFISFLDFSNIFFPPVSAIFIAHYAFVSDRKFDIGDFDKLPNFDYIAIFSWFIGSMVALLANYHFITITTVSFFDSFFVGFIIYVLLKKYKK